MPALRVLGSLELYDEDRNRIAIGSVLRARLLSALALQVGQAVRGDVLAELVWPEGEQPANSANALQTHVARLRRALPPTTGIVTDDRGYRLVIAVSDLDASLFEELVGAAAATPDPARRSDLLGQALDLWRDTPYVDLDHPLAAAEVARLTEARLAAMETRARALWDGGASTDAIGLVKVLVAEAPLREAPVAQLMGWLAATGRQAEALRAYSSLRLTLAEELGIDPSPELRVLEEQVLAQEAPAAAPVETGGSAALPTRVPGDRPRRPRLPASSFVGRDTELREVSGLLGPGRVVTLHGPGGVGKTRLARHVGAQVADAYRDGVTLIDLSTVRDPERVAEAVAVALRLELRGPDVLEEHLAEIISVGRRLLVLDCCEHVIEGVAALVDRVLIPSGGTDVLATSRERLRVDGEFVVKLDLLPIHQSVELFLDRIGTAGAGHPGAEDQEIVQEICEGLDGLPLALELAAARVPTVGLQGLKRGLARPFELLRGGNRTAVAHHRSLREVVEWSYGLLAPDEQEVFGRFSVFAGPVEADDASAVLADDRLTSSVVRQALPDLVDRSLVVAETSTGDTCYRLLDTLRAFGREAVVDHLDALQARHASWARGLAEAASAGLRGSEEHLWARRIDLHLADLLAAHRWLGENGDVPGQLVLAAALGRQAMWRYRLDIASLVERTVTGAGDIGDPNLPEVLGCAGTIAWQRGDLDEAERLATRAVEVAVRAGVPHAARFGHDVMANVALFRGDSTQARTEAELTVSQSSAEADLHLEMDGFVVLTLTLVYAGDYAAAESVEARAAALAEEVGAPFWQCRLAYLRGERLAHLDPEAAAPHLEEAVKLAEEIDALFSASVARHTLVTTAARRMPPAEAVAAFGPLIEHWHRTGAWTQLWVAVRGLVAALARLGWYREAALLLGAHDTSPRATPSYGADAALLAATTAEVSSALGPEAEAVRAEGASLDDAAAVSLAFEVMRSAGDATHPRSP